MTQADFFQLYIATLVTLGGLAGYVITHLLSEIKRLNTHESMRFTTYFSNAKI
jgi:hypothetical protein